MQKTKFSLPDLIIKITSIQAVWIIIILGFVVYANSLFNGFVLDDALQVVSNPYIQSLKNIPNFFFKAETERSMAGAFYRPVFISTYTLLHAFFGNSSFIYHLFQLSLHIVNSILVLCLLILYSIRDFVRNRNWLDNLTLYSHDTQLETNYLLENGYGYELFKDKKYDEAKLHLENSVSMAPYASMNWTSLGVTYYYLALHTNDKDYYQKTETAFSKAIENQSKNFMASENLAFFYYFNSDPQKAKNFVDGRIKIIPNDAKLWFVKGLVENKLGNKNEALISAQNAFNLSKSYQARELIVSLQTGGNFDIEQSSMFP